MELRIHVASVLIGAGVLGLVLLATGAQHVLTDPQPKTLKWPVEVEETVRVMGIPRPEEHVIIEELVPFIVPEGKILVLTGVGIVGGADRGDIHIDGASFFEGYFSQQGGRLSVIQLPPGLSAGPGTLVEAVGPGNLTVRQALVYGYLADA